MAEETHTAWCPRCDRKFLSSRSQAVAIQQMEKHVERAHPEYVKGVDF